LQILFYYDNRWSLLLQRFICYTLLWIVYVPGYSVEYSGLQSCRKNDTAPVPPSELLVSMNVALAPELSLSWLQLQLLVVFTH